MNGRMRDRTAGIAVAMGIGLAGAGARGQDWPEVFDPAWLVPLNLSMDDADWTTIQNDETFDVEVPAMLWADGEKPILVSVRRKSADPLRNGTSFSKVSLKIDINEFVDDQLWHGLAAVSLENGDDIDVVTEGFAWFMHRSASGPEGYDLEAPAGLANWATLTINGEYTGVYANTEQRDKQFLRNRGLWQSGETWMYEVEDINGPPELKEGDGDSPTYLALCYRPFREDCATPPPEVLAAELPQYIEMQTLLTMGAVTSFCADPDHVFSKGKNFHFADWATGRKRQYYPWDLDSSFSNPEGYDIYSERSWYSQILLNVPEFRAQYSQIFNDLLCGPLSAETLTGFLDAVEPVLADALAADPNSNISDSIPEHFDKLRAKAAARVDEVKGMIEGFTECDAACTPDWNADGRVDTLDFLAYLNDWSARNPRADLNEDGVVNTQDFLVFLNLWSAGC